MTKPTLLRMREGKPGGGKGPLLSEDMSLTLTGVQDVLFQPMSVQQGWGNSRETIWMEPISGALATGLDSHRYRCCGNGVVSNVAEWLGMRLREGL